MTVPESASRKLKQLDAGSFQPEISSFGLHLAAEGKAEKTVRTYTEAVQWCAGEHPLKQAAGDRWEQVTRQDVRQWMIWLLTVTAALTPAASTGPCGSSSDGWPARKRSPTRGPG